MMRRTKEDQQTITITVKWITTIGYQSQRLERPNGITPPSIMSRPWLVPEFLVSLSQCHNLAGNFSDLSSQNKVVIVFNEKFVTN